MDYFDVLKKAWRITWRYKALWVLGLFAGAGGGSSSGGGNSSYRTSGEEFSSGGMDRFASWFSDNVVLVAILIGVLVIISIVFWVLSIAAQGGLVYGANEAAEERKPSLRTAWGVGFKYWGRTFMISLVLGLPILVLVIVGVVIGIAMGIGGAALGDEAGGLAAVGGICLLLPIFVVLVIGLAIVIGIIQPLALRYGVLHNITFGEAIKRGWYDLRAKRGAFVFWLVMLLPGFAFGVILLLLMVPFFLPAIAFAMNDQLVMAAGLLVLGGLLMMVPTAIYGTFVSSAWTVFFRKMNGMEAAAAPAYIPPVPGGYEPPAPPASYAAPAPPVTDAPPVYAPADAPVVDVQADTPVREADPTAPPELPADPIAPPVQPEDAGEAPPTDE